MKCNDGAGLRYQNKDKVWNTILFSIKDKLPATDDLSVQSRLGPFYTQDEVVISANEAAQIICARPAPHCNLPIAIESRNSFSRVLFPVVVDKSKSFALPSNLILGQENPGYVSEGLEKFLNGSG